MRLSAAGCCWLAGLVVTAVLYLVHPGLRADSPYDPWAEATAVWVLLSGPPALLCEIAAWLRRRLPRLRAAGRKTERPAWQRAVRRASTNPVNGAAADPASRARAPRARA